jgi:hypothetical protein
MTLGASSESQPLITLVLRMWQGGPHRESEGLRLQATHVQTGEVAYFRTIEDVAHHIDRLAHSLIRPPIDLSEARRRSTTHG